MQLAKQQRCTKQQHNCYGCTYFCLQADTLVVFPIANYRPEQAMGTQPAMQSWRAAGEKKRRQQQKRRSRQQRQRYASDAEQEK